MSDRIDELVRRIRLASTTAEYAADHEAALTELATIARENAFNATEARGVEEQYRKERDDARAEADKWRKVAEEVAKMAADLWDEFFGAGAGPGKFIDEAVRRILIEQEEAE